MTRASARAPLAALASLIAPLIAPVAGCSTAEQPPAEVAPEVEGERLDRTLGCPDVSVPAPVRFDGATLRELGTCGDLLIEREGIWTLVPVDGEAADLPVGAGASYHAFSPRGRLLRSLDFAAETLTVRAVGTDDSFTLALVDGGLGEGASSGFVLSTQAPGAKLWSCDAGELVVVEPGADGSLADAEPVALQGGVDCETVVGSPMHGRLAFAGADDQVHVADTDAGTVTAVEMPFSRVGGSTLGTRQDSLRWTATGPYLIHVLASVEDSDGAAEVFPFAESLYQLGEPAPLVEQADDLFPRQAGVFGAPLFVTVDTVLSGIRDGERIDIVAGVNGYAPRVAIDGSVVLTSEDGAVVRYSGERWDQTTIEVPAAAGQTGLKVSPSGSAGFIVRETSDCVSPDCDETIWISRQFGPDGVGPELSWAGYPFVLHMFDDGAALVRGRRWVDGGADPAAADALVLVDAAGEALASQSIDEQLAPNDPAVLAGERVLVALSHFSIANQVLLVDRAAGTIAPVEALDPTVYELERITSDALGQRVAVQLRGSGGVLWGEI